MSPVQASTSLTRCSIPLQGSDGVVRETIRVKQMEFVEEGRHRRQAAVNRHAGEASLILVFHEGHTVTAINRLWWFVGDRKEDLQIVGVVDPGM